MNSRLSNIFLMLSFRPAATTKSGHLAAGRNLKKINELYHRKVDPGSGPGRRLYNILFVSTEFFRSLK